MSSSDAMVFVAVPSVKPYSPAMTEGGHSLSSPWPWQSSICGNQHNLRKMDHTQHAGRDNDRSTLDKESSAFRHMHPMPFPPIFKTEQGESCSKDAARMNKCPDSVQGYLHASPSAFSDADHHGHVDCSVDISKVMEEAMGGANTATPNSSAEQDGATAVASSSALGAAERIGIQSLQKLYHLRSSDAARSLCISQNTLKRLSEKFKIGRWPHRKLNSLLALQDHIEVSADISSPLRQELLSLIKSNYIDIVSCPESAVHVRLEEMRRRMHKQDYLTRAKLGGTEPSDVTPAAPRGRRRGIHCLPLPVLSASPADRPALDPSSQAIMERSPSSSNQLMAAAAHPLANLDSANSSAPAARQVAGHVSARHQLPHPTAAGPVVMHSDLGPHAMAIIELMGAPLPDACAMPLAESERFWTAGAPRVPTVQLPLPANPGGSSSLMTAGSAWLPCRGDSLFVGGPEDGREATHKSCMPEPPSSFFLARWAEARSHTLPQAGFASRDAVAGAGTGGAEQRMAMGGRSSWHSGYDEAKALLAQDSSWPVDLSPAAPMAVDDDEEDPVNWIPRSLADS